MSRSSGRSGLIVVLIVLAVLAITVDLIRPGSFILGMWRGSNAPQTPVERLMNEFTRTRRVPIPRSNRVLGPGSRSVIPVTQTPTEA